MLQNRLGTRTKTNQTRVFCALAVYLHHCTRLWTVPKMIDGISLRFRFDRPFERPFRNQFSELAPRPQHSVQKIPSNGMQNLPNKSFLISGLATEQVLIFGAVLIFGGYDIKAEAKILQGRSLFNPVLSPHKTQLCMFQRLCTYFQDTGVLIFGGFVLSGHCNQQQISVKTEGVLIFGGVLIYGVLRSPIRSSRSIESAVAGKATRSKGGAHYYYYYYLGIPQQRESFSLIEGVSTDRYKSVEAQLLCMWDGAI